MPGAGDGRQSVRRTAPDLGTRTKVTSEGSGLAPDTSLGHSVGTRMPCERQTVRNSGRPVKDAKEDKTCRITPSWAVHKTSPIWV